MTKELIKQFKCPNCNGSSIRESITRSRIEYIEVSSIDDEGNICYGLSDDDNSPLTNDDIDDSIFECNSCGALIAESLESLIEKLKRGKK